MDFWTRMETRGVESALIAGIQVIQGSRVRLRPRSRADMLDTALDGRLATVEGVEEDDEGHLHVAVTLDDDPGRDLGEARLPGHRFFFPVEEVEPLGPEASGVRILVAGIGNVFLGDDGFGVEVVRRLSQWELPSGVDVVDFGIRGMDLVYALGRGYTAAVFVDTAARGERPGTLSIIEPELPGEEEATVETHGMDPVRVLALARTLGPIPSKTLVVACEPETVMNGGAAEDVVVALSGPVQTAAGEAIRLVESILRDLIVSYEGGERR